MEIIRSPKDLMARVAQLTPEDSVCQVVIPVRREKLTI